MVVALREAARSQRAREIDHEISRRRECITVLGDLWGALVGMNTAFAIFKSYLMGLDPEFDPTKKRRRALLRGPVQTYGEQILERVDEFMDRWSNTVEPPLFNARLVLRGTPLYGSVQQLYEEINNFKAELLTIGGQVIEGQRPDTKPLRKIWDALLARRDEHAQLAHKHFSLDRRDVERYLRQTRRR